MAEEALLRSIIPAAAPAGHGLAQTAVFEELDETQAGIVAALVAVNQRLRIYSTPRNQQGIPAAENQPAQSDGRIRGKASAIPCGSRDNNLIFSLRRTALILDHIFSIGFKLGLYAGRYHNFMPAPCKSVWTSLT